MLMMKKLLRMKQPMSTWISRSTVDGLRTTAQKST